MYTHCFYSVLTITRQPQTQPRPLTMKCELGLSQYFFFVSPPPFCIFSVFCIWVENCCRLMGAKIVFGKTVKSVWTESAQKPTKVCHSAWEIVNGNARRWLPLMSNDAIFVSHSIWPAAVVLVDSSLLFII